MGETGPPVSNFFLLPLFSLVFDPPCITKHPVALMSRETKVKWVRRVILAPLGLQDPQESEAHLDQMDPKDTQ